MLTNSEEASRKIGISTSDRIQRRKIAKAKQTGSKDASPSISCAISNAPRAW